MPAVVAAAKWRRQREGSASYPPPSAALVDSLSIRPTATLASGSEARAVGGHCKGGSGRGAASLGVRLPERAASATHMQLSLHQCSGPGGVPTQQRCRPATARTPRRAFAWLSNRNESDGRAIVWPTDVVRLLKDDCVRALLGCRLLRWASPLSQAVSRRSWDLHPAALCLHAGPSPPYSHTITILCSCSRRRRAMPPRPQARVRGGSGRGERMCCSRVTTALLRGIHI